MTKLTENLTQARDYCLLLSYLPHQAKVYAEVFFGQR